VLLAAAVVLLAGGCEVRGQVAIRLRDDGSGSVAARVTLDPAAVASLEAGGVPYSDRISLVGFADAGWQMGEWGRTPGGGATFRMTHQFADEAELTTVLADLFGDDGWLRDPQIDRERGLIRSSNRLRVDADLADLSGGVLADAELAANLQAAGIDPAAVDAQLAGGIATAFRLEVALALPGGGQRVTRLAPGDAQQLSFTSSSTNYDRLVMVGIGVLLAFLGLMLYLAASISARRRRLAEHTNRRIDLPMW
jgi:hypothetical protein